jgi:hypothetical protein
LAKTNPILSSRSGGGRVLEREEVVVKVRELMNADIVSVDVEDRNTGGKVNG